MASLSLRILEDLDRPALLLTKEGEMLNINQPGLSLFGFKRMPKNKQFSRFLKNPDPHDFSSFLIQSTVERKLDLVLEKKGGETFPARGTLHFYGEKDNSLLLLEPDNGDGLHISSNYTSADILKSITDALFSLDEKWRFRFVNLEAERLLGKSRNELLGKSVWDEFPEAVDSTFFEKYHQAVKTQETVHFEEYYEPLDTWFKVHAFPLDKGLSVYFSDITKQKNDQEILRRYGKQIHGMINALTDGFVAFDRDWKIQFVNAAAERLFGRPGYALIGKVIWEAFNESPEESPLFTLLSPMMDSDEPMHTEIYYPPIHTWYSVRSFPIREGMSVLFSDITEQKDISSAIAASEKKFRSLFEIMSQGVVHQVADGTITDVNPAAEKILGLKKEQLIGEVPELSNRLFKPDGRQMSLAEFPSTKSIRGKKAIVQDIVGYKKPESDDISWLSVNAAPVYDEDHNNPIETFSVFQDVTEQLEYEKRLSQQQELVEAILNSLPSHIAVLNNEGDIIAVNSSWESFGENNQAGDALIKGLGINYIDALEKSKKAGDETASIILDAIISLRSEETDSFSYEYPCHSENDKRWFLLQMTTLANKEGLVMSHTDITQRKLIEQEREDFMHIASHELKTPLTTLKAYAQLLADSLSEMHENGLLTMAERMDKQVDKLAGLVNDLLDVTRIEAGQLKLRKDNVNVGELIEESVDAAQLLFSDHIIELRKNEDVEILADSERIQQVLTNLLTNAVKYSPEANKVEVSVTAFKQHVRICVKDFGIGIPQELQERLFERFQRIRSTEASAPGLGLGLYISKQIVERLGGKLWVRSTPGKGSTFCFTVPLD